MAFTDKIYDVVVSRLARWMVPALLRKPKMLAFVYALVSPFNDVYNRLIFHKDYLQYWLGIDSQVWRMELALNDKYDITGRGIRIVDAPEYLPIPLFKPSENKPVKLFKKSEANPLVLYTKAETAQFSVDFIVKVPLFVSFDMTEMRAFIDTFKTPSKTYKIQVV